jgi:hypothetical protein
MRTHSLTLISNLNPTYPLGLMSKPGVHGWQPGVEKLGETWSILRAVSE